MKILSRIKYVVASVVLLLGNKTLCDANVLEGGAMRNVQIDSGHSFQMASSVSEPATMLLLGVGLVLLAGFAKRGKGEQ